MLLVLKCSVHHHYHHNTGFLGLQDRTQWLELCDKITDTCFVVGENLYPRTGHLKNEELPNPVITNAAVLAMESLTSVSELMTCVKKMEGEGLCSTS